MTLKTRRYTLFDRLYSVYALEPRPAEDSPEPGISPVLSPVIDIADLYPLELLVATLGLDITIGTYVSAFTVPAEQRWHLNMLSLDALTAETAPAFLDPAGTEVRVAANGTTQVFLQEELAGWKLDPRWDIGAPASGNAGDSARVMRLLFRRERLN